MLKVPNVFYYFHYYRSNNNYGKLVFTQILRYYVFSLLICNPYVNLFTVKRVISATVVIKLSASIKICKTAVFVLFTEQKQ